MATENWESEIKDILAKSRSQPSWQELLNQIMPIMTRMMSLSLLQSPVGIYAVYNAEGRERIRRLLAGAGIPPGEVERIIYQTIEKGTKPLEGVINGSSN